MGGSGRCVLNGYGILDKDKEQQEEKIKEDIILKKKKKLQMTKIHEKGRGSTRCVVQFVHAGL